MVRALVADLRLLMRTSTRVRAAGSQDLLREFLHPRRRATSHTPSRCQGRQRDP